MQRLSIFLAIISFCVGANAALLTATNPSELNIPLLDGSFFLGITGAYLQPAGSNGTNDFLAGINVSNTSTLKNVNPDYDWVWGINLGYIFPQTANDINLNYFHFNVTDTASASAPPGGIIGNNILNLQEKIKYDLDQVDLKVGQYINVGCRLGLHPNAGLRWDNIEHSLTHNFTQTNENPALPNGNVTASEKSSLNGIGPLVGIDANYSIGMGFGVVSHFNSALLLSDIDTKANAASINFIAPNTTISIQEALRARQTQRVVPVIDAKLGIDYSYFFAQNSDLTLEIGYQVNNYFNPVDELLISSAGIIQERKTSNLSLNGIYFALLFEA